MDIDTLRSEIESGSARALAKAITLVESRRSDQRNEADRLLTSIMPRTGNSLRIGISGVPGVGKSTLIESFGMQFVNEGKRVAILAVDPSSPITGGSIMGDKTRMEQLAANPSAFIRPSPSQGGLGGVARRTREAILLCEAAAYDVIIIETVGVGQSEVAVASMSDVFVMLQLPNAGDELQGIKKGILELADIVAVTKADGSNLNGAKQTQLQQERALRLVRGKESWFPPVVLTSALTGTGYSDLRNAVDEFMAHQKKTGMFSERRTSQSTSWFKDELVGAIEDYLSANKEILKTREKFEALVTSGSKPAGVAAREMFSSILQD